MAKYNVEHICGHTKEVKLFGPGKDRTRKLVWLADQRCWECERETQRPLAYVFIRFPMRDGKKIAQAVIDVSNSFKIKDQLKSLGYRFEREAADACGRVLGLLSMSRPPAVWRRVFDLPENELAAALQAVDVEAKSLVRDGLVEADALNIELGGGGLTRLHGIFDPHIPFEESALAATE